MSLLILKLSLLFEVSMVAEWLSDKEGNFDSIEVPIQVTRNKDYKVYARKINGRRSQHKPKEILPEYLKQVEEKKEHQHLLKDLKNSRTLPILPPDSISSINLTNYCLCDFQLPAKQPPSSTSNLITLPSPSPLLCESQYFFPAYWQEEQN